MSQVKRRMALAVMAASVGLFTAATRADEDNSQLQQRIDQLEAKIAKLEAAQAGAQNGLTLVRVMVEAERNTGAGSGNMGYDPITEFHIYSDDGNYYLHPWALFQFRGVMNDLQSVQHRDVTSIIAGNTGISGLSPQQGSPENDGWEVQHLMLGVNGHLATPDLQYFVSFDTLTTGGGAYLDDAYATYRLLQNTPLYVKAGQFVDPLWHETNVDDAHLLLVDRSMAAALVGGTFLSPQGIGGDSERVQGVGIAWQGDILHAESDFHDGYDSQNASFLNSTPALPAGVAFPLVEDFGWSARVEYKVMGDWGTYGSMTAKRPIRYPGHRWWYGMDRGKAHRQRSHRQQLR